MFNIVTIPKFSRIVKVQVPEGDGHTEQTFKAHFKAGKDDGIMSLKWNEVEPIKKALREVLISADELIDDKGKPVSYNDEVREGLLCLTYVRTALLKAYIIGQTQDTSGN
ncbi:hypothetical protein [Parasedimentitalea psychrophila]|uniref:Uncharacterized protein n=1 Tax=Parasedimentitalea psychrophila TaxID=2997337 RepID=A0A9Y2P488_9RHOB|nr:hypothetical protein [Parasedimentitalea psychrophila]WIY25064.1 hypothetical protein QPJ95_21665 [Parasedimentitalea psychrophila]